MISKRIKLIRKTLQLTQKEFGKKLSIPFTTVSKYEAALIKPSYEILSKIGKIFNINANWLLSGAGEMFTEEYAAKVDADFQESLDWMIEFCRKVADGEIEQTPEVEETLKSMTKIIKLTTDKGGSK